MWRSDDDKTLSESKKPTHFLFESDWCSAAVFERRAAEAKRKCQLITNKTFTCQVDRLNDFWVKRARCLVTLFPGLVSFNLTIYKVTGVVTLPWLPSWTDNETNKSKRRKNEVVGNESRCCLSSLICIVTVLGTMAGISISLLASSLAR